MEEIDRGVYALRYGVGLVVFRYVGASVESAVLTVELQRGLFTSGDGDGLLTSFFGGMYNP